MVSKLVWAAVPFVLHAWLWAGVWYILGPHLEYRGFEMALAMTMLVAIALHYGYAAWVVFK